MAHKVFWHIEYSESVHSRRLCLLPSSFCSQHSLPHLYASLQWRENLHTATQSGHLWCLVVLYSGANLQFLHGSLLYYRAHGSLFIPILILIFVRPLLLNDHELQKKASNSSHSTVYSQDSDLSSQAQPLVSLEPSVCAILLCDGPDFGLWSCHQCFTHTGEMVSREVGLYFQRAHFDAHGRND